MPSVGSGSGLIFRLPRLPSMILSLVGLRGLPVFKMETLMIFAAVRA